MVRRSRCVASRAGVPSSSGSNGVEPLADCGLLAAGGELRDMVVEGATTFSPTIDLGAQEVSPRWLAAGIPLDRVRMVIGVISGIRQDILCAGRHVANLFGQRAVFAPMGLVHGS